MPIGFVVRAVLALTFSVASAEATPPPVSAAERKAARQEIQTVIAAALRKPGGARVENAGALTSYFASLAEGDPIHILQFGNTHTAAGDWTNAIRAAAQAKYGNGGPGFIHMGAAGGKSPGWKSDADEGLSGLGISTRAAGQTVTLAASGASLQIFYLQQPGGGDVGLTIDGQSAGTFGTDGDLGPGHTEYSLVPGAHRMKLRTLSAAPVRLLGWALDNEKGITVEALGVDGATAGAMLAWNQRIWADELNQRNPSLVILAYGTTEAGSRTWTPAQYRKDLTAVIERIRRAAPAVAILMIGPPDCGEIQPPHLSEVIDVQREITRKLGVAFWDWRLHMGGPGILSRWVTAGLAQTDYIHFTAEGYRMLGKMVFDAVDAVRVP